LKLLILKFLKQSLKEQEIEKLKEYKASLINSAVTGKVKLKAAAIFKKQIQIDVNCLKVLDGSPGPCKTSESTV